MLFRFAIQLADVDRGVYQDLDLRVHMHPSEDTPFLLTRVLAFALEHKEGLEFSRGLSDGDEPAIWSKGPDGRVIDWIEVGAPAPDRLHRASKACERVVVWCHRRPDALQQRCAREKVHRGDRLDVVKVPPELLRQLETKLDRNNRWDVSRHEGIVTVVVGGEAFEAPLEVVALQPPLQ